MPLLRGEATQQQRFGQLVAAGVRGSRGPLARTRLPVRTQSAKRKKIPNLVAHNCGNGESQSSARSNRPTHWWAKQGANHRHNNDAEQDKASGLGGFEPLLEQDARGTRRERPLLPHHLQNREDECKDPTRCDVRSRSPDIANRDPRVVRMGRSHSSRITHGTASCYFTLIQISHTPSSTRTMRLSRRTTSSRFSRRRPSYLSSQIVSHKNRNGSKTRLLRVRH